MLKIKDDVDLKILLKIGFKEIQQNKRINYIYMPNEVWTNCSNSIVINNDRNLFSINYYIDEDREIRFRLNEQASEEFEKVMGKFYDLIQAGLVEKVEEAENDK